MPAPHLPPGADTPASACAAGADRRRPAPPPRRSGTGFETIRAEEHHRGRRLTLHLPGAWRRAQEWTSLFEAARGPQVVAA
jgi:hypothetical protein